MTVVFVFKIANDKGEDELVEIAAQDILEAVIALIGKHGEGVHLKQLMGIYNPDKIGTA